MLKRYPSSNGRSCHQAKRDAKIFYPAHENGELEEKPIDRTAAKNANVGARASDDSGCDLESLLSALPQLLRKMKANRNGAWKRSGALPSRSRMRFWRRSALRRMQGTRPPKGPAFYALVADVIATAWCQNPNGCRVFPQLDAILDELCDAFPVPLSCHKLRKALANTAKVKSHEIHAELFASAMSRQSSAPPWKAAEVAAQACRLDYLDVKTLNAEVYQGKDKDEAFQHPFIQSLLAQARDHVKKGAPWVLCIRTYGRSGLAHARDGVRLWKQSRGGLLGWTLHALEVAGFKRPELLDRVHIFVSHEDAHFLSGRYELALGPTWASRIIVGVKGADLQVRFIEECFCRGQHVVVCDDNVVWIKASKPPAPDGTIGFRELRRAPCELAKLIRSAGIEMQRRGAHIWSLNPTSNPLFMSSVAAGISTSLGLVYGAFFGFICLHEPQLYTQFGQVKDDLERTLRYWDRDRIILRYRRYAIKKVQKPGAFRKCKGGISALGEQAHKAEADSAIQKIVSGFAADYVRLPEADSDQRFDKRTGGYTWKSAVSDTGVVFCAAHTAKPVLGTVAIAGYSCFSCRSKSHNVGLTNGAASLPSVHDTAHDCSLCINPLMLKAQQLFLDERRTTPRAPSLLTNSGRAIAVSSAGLQFDNVSAPDWASLSADERHGYMKAAAKQLALGTESKQAGSNKKQSRACMPSLTDPQPVKKRRRSKGPAVEIGTDAD